jgi:Flp pilus assembly protein TadB
VLSERERKALAEIERHLRDDDRLRAFETRSWRRARQIRRLWFLLLLVSGILVVGTAALGSALGAADSLLLGAVTAVFLYFSPPSRRESDDP